MPLMLTDKQAIVAQVSEVAKNALSVVAADYRGLTVSQMTQLRADARSKNVHIQVIRNTLAKRAVAGTRFECMQESLTGPLVLAFSDTPSAAARLVRDFAKDHKTLEVKALSIGETVLGPENLESIASLPTKDEAISMLMSVMKAPVEKLARTLNEVPGKLVRTVDAVRVAKDAA